jgi:YD repeat-containing protein
MGFAEKGLAQSASGWLLHEYTYNASGQMTAKQISYDAWTDRTITTYE